MRALNRAIEIRPDFADAHYNLGNTQRSEGMKTAGDRIVSQGSFLRPDFPEA